MASSYYGVQYAVTTTWITFHSSSPRQVSIFHVNFIYFRYTLIDVYCWAYLSFHAATTTENKFPDVSLSQEFRRFPTLVAYWTNLDEQIRPILVRKWSERFPERGVNATGIRVSRWTGVSQLWTTFRESWIQSNVSGIGEGEGAVKINYTKTGEEMEKDREMRRQRWVSIFTGIAVMLVYVVYNGIIQVKFDDEDEEQEVIEIVEEEHEEEDV